MKERIIGFDLTLSLNSITINYNDVGEGNIPIIFIHGFPFDKSMWQPQIDALQEKYRLILYDIRGFGKSTYDDSPFSIDLFADDLIQLMDALELKKATICGLSMGGYIALNAVKRFPERFEALILCDTQCIADTEEVKSKRYETIDEIDANGADDFKEKFIQKVVHKDFFVANEKQYEQLRKVVFANPVYSIIQGLIALAERSETCSFLHEITIPTLILCGREDEVTPLAQSVKMNKAIEGSVLHIIDNAGHVSNLEQPEIFNAHVLEFLSTVTNLNIEEINGGVRMT